MRTALLAALDRWSSHLDLSNILDLACGSGEVTLTLRERGCQHITGIDPYTYTAYEERTEQAALRFSFDDIASGAISDHNYSLIICSYALHLVEKSKLPVLCYRLAQVSGSLLILTPHKRPDLKAEWGWKLQGEFVLNRARVRLYTSDLKMVSE